MEKQDAVLISRNRIKLGLNYVQSISEKALELDNYYKEREILYQEYAKQEEIILRPAPITEIALLDKPAGDEAENDFYFGAQCQINREIRKLEDAMEAKERHLRAKARRQTRKDTPKEPRKPIKLRNYSAKPTKKSTSTIDPDQLALPSTATLALPPTDTPTPTPQESKRPKRTIQIRTQTPKKTKISRQEIPKEKKTVEEIMMAHLQPLQPNIKKTNGPRKIVLLDKALPSSAPPIRKKRRRLVSKSDSAKKVKNNLENVSKLNDHGTVFDQFGECPVPPQEPMLTEEVPPSPSKDKPSPTPKRNDLLCISSQNKNIQSFECHADYHADFEDSDTEMDQNDSLLTSSDRSPASPIVSSTPKPIIPLDIPISSDSGKESNESIEVRSPSLELPPVSSREPSPLSETSTTTPAYVPNLEIDESSRTCLEKFMKFFQDSEDDEQSVNQESEDDCFIVATGNKYAPEEVIMLDDSDAEVEAIDTGPDVEIIGVEENNAVLGEIEINAWLDARRLPVGFSYQVGQKVKYGELQYKILLNLDRNFQIHLAEIDDEHVIATIHDVSQKERLKCGNGVMVVQKIEILLEETNQIIGIDAAEISHIFWDRVTDSRYSNSVFNIKHESVFDIARCEPSISPIKTSVIVANPFCR